MNGARSIFMRKGYWLTALAAIVLLAASPGTASAQVTVTGPDEVVRGRDRHVYRGHQGIYAPGGADTVATATVTLTEALPRVDENASTQNLGAKIFHESRFPANSNFLRWGGR